MSEVGDRERLNYERLLDRGVTMSSKLAQSRLAEDYHRSSGKTGNELPADLVLTDLARYPAIAIARNLSAVLAGDVEAGLEQVIADFEASVKSTNDNEPVVFQERPAEHYSVLVGVQDIGKYALQASFRGRSSRRKEGLIELNQAFRQALDTLSIPSPEDEPDEISVSDVTVPVPAGFVRDSRYAQGDSIGDEKWEEMSFEHDFGESRKMARILGLADVETTEKEPLVELWRSRNNDPLAMIDLYMYMFSDKQKVEGSRNYYPENLVQDMIDAGRDYSPLELRRYLEDESLGVLTSRRYGLSRQDAEAFFQTRLEDDEEKLKLRFITWLVDLPAMQPFAKDLKLALTQRSFAGFYDRTLKNIADLGRQHAHQKRNTPDEFSGFNYDPRKRYHLSSHTRKLDFFKTTFLIGVYLFKGENDVDKVLNRLDR